MTVGGTLDNDSGSLAIGNAGLGASTNVTAAGLSNTGGSIGITGNTTLGTTHQASLKVAAAAPATWTGTVSLSGDALLQFAGTSQIGAIGSGASISINGPQAFVAAAGVNTTSNSALSGLSSNAGTFDLVNGASVTTTGVGLTNTGGVSVDGGFDAGGGGSSLTLGGALTNSAGAGLDIGNGGLTASSTVQATSLSNSGAISLDGNGAAHGVLTLAGGLTNTGSVNVDNSFGSEVGGSTATVGGALDNDNGSLSIGNAGLGASTNVTAGGLSNTGGSIGITGNTTLGTTHQASLKVAAAAPATWTGTVSLSGDALLQFAGTSQIGAIGSGASISINGPQAFVAAAGVNTTSNSALSGLSSNAGTLDLVNGASVTTTGVGLTNTGGVSVDGGFDAGGGGSSLTLGGALTNSAGAGLAIGNGGLTASSTVQATSLSNSGAISLDGNGAAHGVLTLAGGLTNTGSVNVDNSFGSEVGGSTATVGGALDNDNGSLSIGNAGLGASTNVSAGGLSNTGGSIGITGNTTLGTTHQASLKVAAAAPATWTGTVSLSGDALLQFAGTSQIGAIGSGASISINGPQAFVAAAGVNTTSNSALSGLSSNAGTLDLVNGASVTTTGVGLTNTGGVSVDGGFDAGGGGSSLTLGGALTNSAGAGLAIGNGGLTASSTVQATSLSNSGAISLDGNGAAHGVLTLAGGLTNTGSVNVDNSFGSEVGGSTATVGGALDNDNGSLSIGNAGLGASTNVTATGLSNTGGGIGITGNTTLGTTHQASLKVAAAAPATWTGTVSLSGDALLQFAGTSQIGAIGSGASISINGPQAFVAAAGVNTTSNSALSGLSSNAGTLDLVNGASVTTTGVGLTNTGGVSVDGGFDAGGGGSSLTLGGALTNSAGAGLAIGNGGLTASSTVQATSLSNSGAISLDGNGAAHGVLTLAGGLTNTGSVNVDNSFGSEVGGSTATVGGALDNDNGSLSIGNAGLGASTNVSAGGLSNTGGSIGITGNTTLGTTHQASLKVAAAAPATWTGTVSLSGDALLQFAGTSQIGAIGSGASISINGPQAFVAAAGVNTTSNSALSGLSSNAGTLDLVNGASVTTTGVGLTNTGGVSVDGGFDAGGGGSSLTLGGALTNSAGAGLAIGNGGLTASSTVQATSLSNSGAISLDGNGAAHGVLTLAGGLTNTGSVNVDNSFGSEVGGSTATVGGALDNDNGSLSIGNAGLGASTNVSAGGLSNTGGTINMVGGSATNVAKLTVNGAASNAGTANIGAFSNLAVTGAGNAYTQTAGTTTIVSGGTLTAPNVNLTGGILQGNGTVAGTVNVSAAGTVEAINPSTANADTLTVSGAYNQSGGTLAALLQGTGEGQVGTVAVASGNSVKLTGGNLTSAPGSIAYAAGQTFSDVMTFQPGQLFGTFAQLQGLGNGVSANLGGGLTLEAFYNNSVGNISLGVISTPATTGFTWTDGTADWNTPGDWSGGVVPTPVANVTIGSGAGGTVSLNQDSTINSLTIGAGTSTGYTLQVNGGNTLTVASSPTSVTVNNGGTMTLGGTLNTLGTVTVNTGGTLGLSGGTIIDATLAGPGTMQTNTSGTLNAITISSGSTFTGLDVATTLVGTITNHGTIQVNGGGGDAGDLNIAGAVTLTGGGTVALSTATGGGGAFIQGTGATLTNVDNMITGTGFIGNTNLALINSGTINADSGAGTGVLTINGTGGVTNTNLFEATSGGTLQIGGGGLAIPITVNNTGGNITANNATVQLTNAVIQGGTLNTINNGTMLTAGGSNALDGSTNGPLAISSGSTFTNSNNSGTTLTGTIANKGTIQVNGGSGANGLLNIAGNVTLKGDGTVTLSTATGGGDAIIQGTSATLTNVDNTIQGAGIIGNTFLAVTNGGTIDATPSGGTSTLTLSPVSGVTNTNLLEATSGGVLQISATTVDNAGGNITVGDATSTVQLSNATIQGGTLNNNAGGTMETAAGGATLDGSTASGAVTISTGSTYTASNGLSNGIATTLKGSIVNNGTIQLNGGGGNNALLSIAGNVTLSGGGTVVLSTATGGGDASISGPGQTLTNLDNTITGTGTVGNGTSLAVTNGGTIDADSAAGIGTLALNAGGGVTNTNLLEATNGGTLQISTTVNNAGASITANNGTVQVFNGVVQGGTLNTLNAGTMETVGSFATLDGSTASGAVTISTGSTYTASNSTTTNLNGAIVNNGTIQLNGGTGTNGILNLAGNVTLSGGGTLALSTATGGGNAIIQGVGQTLTNVDNTIAGTGNIGNGADLAVTNGGAIEATPAGGTSTLTLNGVGGLANNGTFAANNGGTLTATVPFTNTGTVHAINGTINANAGFTGTTGTAQIDAAGTLSIGAASTVGTLAQNGSLVLGTNNITVSTDYSNANFGTGNSFNKLADVTTTTGEILAAGPTPSNMQVITGADVTGGTTTTPTLALGNVHAGASATYQIANEGTAANPSLRGAIQTNVNGGNINPSLISGSGVTAANFGPLASGASTGSYTVTVAGAGSLSGQALHIANNFGNVPEQTINITGAAYALASPTVTSSLNPMFNFGVVIAGQTYTDPLTITNTLVASSAAFQEGLNASFGTPTNSQLTTNSGTITNLAAGASNSTAMSVSLTPTIAGTIGGTVPISFASNGATTSGLGITSLAGQNLNYDWTFMGMVVNPASPSITPTTINFGNVRIDTTQQQALSVTNISTTAPQASLDAQISAVGPATSNGGSITQLLAGAPANTTSLIAGLSTANAGAQSGTATVALQSDSTPNGCISDCIADLPSQPITVTGDVFRLATGSATSPVSLGNVRINTTLSGNLSVTNTAANDGFSENLDAAISATTPDITGSSGSVSGLAAGLTNSTGLSVTLGSSSAGAKSGTATVQFQSDGTGIDGGAPVDNGSQTVTVTGNVFRLATGSATSPVSLGNVRINTALSGNLSVTNAAANDGFSENLDAAISATTPDITGSGGSVTGLAAGLTNSTGLSVTLGSSSAGAKSGTATVQFQSDGTGIDGGAPVDNGSQTVTVTGNVFRLATGSATSPASLGAARVGIGTLSGNLSVTNTAANDGFSENLDAAISATTPDITGSSGSVSGLAAGQTNSTGLNVTLNNSSAGAKSGTATVQFQSDGTGIDGGAPIDNGSQVVTVTGNVYTPAVANVLMNPPIDFGIVHVGDGAGTIAKSVTVQNGAAITALNDVMTGSISAGPTPPFSGSGTLGAGLAPGASSSALQVDLATGTAGIFNGTANLDLSSHDSQLADLSLATSPLSLNAQVNLFAKLALEQTGGDGKLTGGGTSYDLDFGNVVRGSPTQEALLAILNDNPLADQAFTDLLSTNPSGTAAPFSLAGCSASGLPGGDSQSCDALFDTSSLGSFMDSVTFDVESSNASGYDQIIGDVTLNLEGDIVPPTVPEPGSIALLAPGLFMLFFVVRRERRRR